MDYLYGKKLVFFLNIFCLFLIVATFTPVFKDKMSLRSHKTVVYLTFLHVDGKIRIRVQIRIRQPIMTDLEAQKHTDPDPEDCF